MRDDRPLALREEAVWWAVLGGLLLVSVLNNTTLASLAPVGETALAAIMGVGGLLGALWLTLRPAIRRRHLPLLACVAYVQAVYFARFLVDPQLGGMKNVAETAGALTFFLFIVLYRWRQPALRLLSGLLSVFVLVNAGLYLWMGLGREFGRFTGVFSNPNTHGGFMMLSFFALLLTWRQETGLRRHVLVAMGTLAVLLTIASGARSAWLALFAAGLSYLAWPTLSRNRTRHFAHLGAVGLGIAFLVVVVLLLPIVEPLQQLEALAQEYTGAGVTTGRELVWLDVVREIVRQPFLGHGPHVTARGFGGLRLHSAHNLYFQIVLQVGTLGLVGFLALVANIWWRLWDARDRVFARLTAVVLVAVLVHQTFEVSLTQNNLTLGLLALSVVGIGLSRALHDSDTASSRTRSPAGVREGG